MGAFERSFDFQTVFLTPCLEHSFLFCIVGVSIMAINQEYCDRRHHYLIVSAWAFVGAVAVILAIFGTYYYTKIDKHDTVLTNHTSSIAVNDTNYSTIKEDLKEIKSFNADFRKEMESRLDSMSQDLAAKRVSSVR